MLGLLNEPAISELVGPVRNSERTDEQTVRRVILGLCEGRYLTLRQLAELLNRGMDGLRDRHISKMVKAGQLELKYPDRPSHGSQGFVHDRRDENFLATPVQSVHAPKSEAEVVPRRLGQVFQMVGVGILAAGGDFEE